MTARHACGPERVFDGPRWQERAVLEIVAMMATSDRPYCENFQKETPMKKIIAVSTGLLLLAGMSIASAQTAGTPGAGSPGQDQRGATGQGPGAAKTPGTPPTADAPPSTQGAGSMSTVPAAPPAGGSVTVPNARGSDNLPSATDRDSRGLPKDTR
jgi:hypothetical protein